MLLHSDLHLLGGRQLRLGSRAAQRARGRRHRLDADVRADAAHLRLLSSQRAAAVVAIRGVGAAADLCLRGYARAPGGARLPDRPDAVRARAQCGAAAGVVCGIPDNDTKRPPRRLAAIRWWINRVFPVEMRRHWPLSRVGLCNCALTHIYAFGTMLHSKED